MDFVIRSDQDERSQNFYTGSQPELQGCNSVTNFDSDSSRARLEVVGPILDQIAIEIPTEILSANPGMPFKK
jgi:hypothetical protein